jgi:hypothetical protein
MAQILDSLPEGQSDNILCCYVNATSQIQIARITNIPNWYFERVVFPGQRLVFEALPEALLEIHTGMMASAILSDTIPCYRIRVKEDGDVEVNPTSKSSETVAETRSSNSVVDSKSSHNTTPLKAALSV